ncbi:MAG: helix-turn-helix transcriptional regulator, partial [Candidatus Omnitrophota bacterium]
MEKEQNLVEFGERLKQIRLALKLNQAQMAKSINVSNTAISEIENGKYKPGYDFFMSLVKIHRVNFNHLMFGEGKMFLEPETVPDTGPMKMPPESNEEEFFLYHFKRS